MHRMAAIDLGSNAVRLLIAHREKNGKINFETKVRAPLRLGNEAFSEHALLSDSLIEYAQFVFSEFAEIIKKENIDDVVSLATSAFREAKNSEELKSAIKKSSGIELQKISGAKEGALILNAVHSEFNFSNYLDYLLFDIGGGSIELSRIKKGQIKNSKSFKIGTVRWLLQEKNQEQDFKSFIRKVKKEIYDYVEQEFQNSESVDVIGTGGNFRSLLKLNRLMINKSTDFIKPEELEALYETLNLTSYNDRIESFGMKPDRADVILPAIKIIKMVIKGLPVNKIFSSDLGLVHGIALEHLQD